MTEKEAIAYIENYGWSATRLGLGRTFQLLRGLGQPQEKLKFIHVAGSNGKGSTCAMLDAILRAAGYRVGLYTSPYIQTFCERIQINGVNIPGQRLAALTERVRALADGMDDHPSQFELVTAIAMEYFREENCDIVVLEVGMGGALDSTNVIPPPEAAVIANIGLEHTEYLGRTLGEIAMAKAGIIKHGCHCVCYDGAEEATRVVRQVCAERDVPLRCVDFSRMRSLRRDLGGQDFTWDGTQYRLRLLGCHQLHNAALVLETVGVLRQRGWTIPEHAVAAGLAAVTWPARLEVLSRRPLFLLDGGHNPQCASALAESLHALLPGRKVTFLVGVLADKDYDSMIRVVLPCAKGFICLTPLSDRALPAEKLQKHIEALGASAVACESIEQGIAAALSQTGGDGCAAAFGSLYLAGAVRTAFYGAFRQWLRKEKIRARDGLSPETRAVLSAEIVRRLLASPEFQKAKTVMLYRAVRGEVSLAALERAAAAAGKRFVYPLCVSKTEMLALLPGGDDAWRPGSFGIPEPILERSQPVAPEDIELVLCPCTAFDESGGRLGMGGGYYDRFLSKCKNARIAAVAFEAQKAEAIPTEQWDWPMDLVFTEKGRYEKGCCPEK